MELLSNAFIEYTESSLVSEEEFSEVSVSLDDYAPAIQAISPAIKQTKTAPLHVEEISPTMTISVKDASKLLAEVSALHLFNDAPTFTTPILQVDSLVVTSPAPAIKTVDKLDPVSTLSEKIPIFFAGGFSKPMSDYEAKWESILPLFLDQKTDLAAKLFEVLALLDAINKNEENPKNFSESYSQLCDSILAVKAVSIKDSQKCAKCSSLSTYKIKASQQIINSESLSSLGSLLNTKLKSMNSVVKDTVTYNSAKYLIEVHFAMNVSSEDYLTALSSLQAVLQFPDTILGSPLHPKTASVFCEWVSGLLSDVSDHNFNNLISTSSICDGYPSLYKLDIGTSPSFEFFSRFRDFLSEGSEVNSFLYDDTPYSYLITKLAAPFFGEDPSPKIIPYMFSSFCAEELFTILWPEGGVFAPNDNIDVIINVVTTILAWTKSTASLLFNYFDLSAIEGSDHVETSLFVLFKFYCDFVNIFASRIISLPAEILDNETIATMVDDIGIQLNANLLLMPSWLLDTIQAHSKITKISLVLSDSFGKLFSILSYPAQRVVSLLPRTISMLKSSEAKAFSFYLKSTFKNSFVESGQHKLVNSVDWSPYRVEGVRSHILSKDNYIVSLIENTLKENISTALSNNASLKPCNAATGLITFSIFLSLPYNMPLIISLINTAEFPSPVFSHFRHSLASHLSKNPAQIPDFVKLILESSLFLKENSEKLLKMEIVPEEPQTPISFNFDYIFDLLFNENKIIRNSALRSIEILTQSSLKIETETARSLILAIAKLPLALAQNGTFSSVTTSIDMIDPNLGSVHYPFLRWLSVVIFRLHSHQSFQFKIDIYNTPPTPTTLLSSMKPSYRSLAELFVVPKSVKKSSKSSLTLESLISQNYDLFFKIANPSLIRIFHPLMLFFTLFTNFPATALVQKSLIEAGRVEPYLFSVDRIDPTYVLPIIESFGAICGSDTRETQKMMSPLSSILAFPSRTISSQNTSFNVFINSDLYKLVKKCNLSNVPSYLTYCLSFSFSRLSTSAESVKNFVIGLFKVRKWWENSGILCFVESYLHILTTKSINDKNWGLLSAFWAQFALENQEYVSKNIKSFKRLKAGKIYIHPRFALTCLSVVIAEKIYFPDDYSVFTQALKIVASGDSIDDKITFLFSAFSVFFMMKDKADRKFITDSVISDVEKLALLTKMIKHPKLTANLVDHLRNPNLLDYSVLSLDPIFGYIYKSKDVIDLFKSCVALILSEENLLLAQAVDSFMGTDALKAVGRTIDDKLFAPTCNYFYPVSPISSLSISPIFEYCNNTSLVDANIDPNFIVENVIYELSKIVKNLTPSLMNISNLYILFQTFISCLPFYMNKSSIERHLPCTNDSCDSSVLVFREATNFSRNEKVAEKITEIFKQISSNEKKTSVLDDSHLVEAGISYGKVLYLGTQIPILQNSHWASICEGLNLILEKSLEMVPPSLMAIQLPQIKANGFFDSSAPLPPTDRTVKCAYMTPKFNDFFTESICRLNKFDCVDLLKSAIVAPKELIDVYFDLLADPRCVFDEEFSKTVIENISQFFKKEASPFVSSLIHSAELSEKMLDAVAQYPHNIQVSGCFQMSNAVDHENEHFNFGIRIIARTQEKDFDFNIIRNADFKNYYTTLMLRNVKFSKDFLTPKNVSQLLLEFEAKIDAMTHPEEAVIAAEILTSFADSAAAFCPQKLIDLILCFIKRFPERSSWSKVIVSHLANALSSLNISDLVSNLNCFFVNDIALAILYSSTPNNDVLNYQLDVKTPGIIKVWFLNLFAGNYAGHLDDLLKILFELLNTSDPEHLWIGVSQYCNGGVSSPRASIGQIIEKNKVLSWHTLSVDSPIFSSALMHSNEFVENVDVNFVNNFYSTFPIFQSSDKISRLSHRIMIWDMITPANITTTSDFQKILVAYMQTWLVLGTSNTRAHLDLLNCENKSVNIKHVLRDQINRIDQVYRAHIISEENISTLLYAVFTGFMHSIPSDYKPSVYLHIAQALWDNPSIHSLSIPILTKLDIPFGEAAIILQSLHGAHYTAFASLTQSQSWNKIYQESITNSYTRVFIGLIMSTTNDHDHRCCLLLDQIANLSAPKVSDKYIVSAIYSDKEDETLVRLLMMSRMADLFNAFFSELDLLLASFSKPSPVLKDRLVNAMSSVTKISRNLGYRARHMINAFIIATNSYAKDLEFSPGKSMKVVKDNFTSIDTSLWEMIGRAPSDGPVPSSLNTTPQKYIQRVLKAFL